MPVCQHRRSATGRTDQARSKGKLMQSPRNTMIIPNDLRGFYTLLQMRKLSSEFFGKIT